MMWPFRRKPEERSGGGYSDVIARAIESAAGVKASDVGQTAALEAASGFVSRAFMAAQVSPSIEGVTPEWLGMVGRSLVRSGESMSLISMAGGKLQLVPCGYWDWQDSGHPENPEAWQCRVSIYGPSSSQSRLVDRTQLIYVAWGSSPGERYRGRSPTSWASLSSRMAASLEKSLSDELSGPTAMLIPIPHNPSSDDDESNPLAGLGTSIANAKGGALLVESTQSGWADGTKPSHDWRAERLGAEPPPVIAEIQKQAFMHSLASCGLSPSLFDNSDGTSKRESLRQAHMGVIKPLARQLERELQNRLDDALKIRFDPYPMDIAARTQSVSKLVAAGMDLERALRIVGLDDG